MKSVIKTCFGLLLSLFLVISVCVQSVEAQLVIMTTDVDIENEHSSMDSKSIDDLLGPDTNFPFDPANHRDGSNPIKRIGKISDDNL
ncbi:hypothetical protein [Prochlorococcus marinus]|uniref:Uncharacterized protein n=1 Tax=Prochlorococcus marinus XMU1408 TaxID=2213228 RepID=A0A318R138_PROMR|nr:hypothetical protein [Prochlorococcus marinus]MBW3042091.1 hypothetical protein [Prochlorococcus marinus str. XMU1408]PYE03207.1 hypothetical protein DNJ73_05580 [Prochlorococcus marinus XMU1408]